MRNDDPELDSSLSEEVPERESPAGAERKGDASEGGIERETIDEPESDAGVESPPRDADRANLLP